MEETNQPLYDGKSHMCIAKYDDVIGAAMAFGFYDWIEKDWKVTYNWQAIPLAVASVRVALHLASRFQILWRDLPIGMVYNEIVPLNPQIAAIQRSLVTGRHGKNDGSWRSRMESGYGNYFDVLPIPDGIFDNVYENGFGQWQIGYDFVPLWANLFAWLELLEVPLEGKNGLVSVRKDWAQTVAKVGDSYSAAILKQWPAVTDYPAWAQRAAESWWNQTRVDDLGANLRYIASYNSRVEHYALVTSTLSYNISEKIKTMLLYAGKYSGPIYSHIDAVKLIGVPYMPMFVNFGTFEKERLVWFGDTNRPVYMSSVTMLNRTALNLQDQPIDRVEVSLLDMLAVVT